MTVREQGRDEPEVREQLASVGHFMRKVLRFWPELLGLLLAGGVAFGVFLHFHQPRYRSETVILYVEKGDTTEEVESSDTQRSVTVRLKELLYARPNLERVVQKFGLYPALRSGYGMVDAVEELKKHVDFRAPGGDTFSIGFEGASASEAQVVTQELARLVIDGDAELRKKAARVALDFLVGERQTRDAELKQAEEQLASFMAQHPRFALDATPLANGAAIRATMGAPAVGGQVVRSWSPRAAAPNAAPVTAAAVPLAPASKPDPEEARARAALAAARETLTQKLEHYTPAHPDVRAAEAAVQSATERLAAVTGGAGAAVAAPKPAVAEAPAAPAASVAAAPHPAPAAAPRPAPVFVRTQPAAQPSAARTETLVELETEWLKLTRSVTEARQRLDQIEAQLFRADIEVNSEKGGHAVQVSVIDPAFLPQRPVPPGRATLGLIFLAAAFVLGLLLMIVRATLDDRVFDARDVGAGLAVLAEVPRTVQRRRYAAG